MLCKNFEEVFVKEDGNEVVIKSNEEVTGEKPENCMKICDDEDTVSLARSNNNIIGEKPYEGMTDYNSENYVNFDAEIITKKLMKLMPEKSSGPVGLHPMLLKNCAKEISKPLSVIFGWSYDQGELPKEWKQAHITSIYKKGDISKAGNNRPVSLTSVVCKVMEPIIKVTNAAFLLCRLHL